MLHSITSLILVVLLLPAAAAAATSPSSTLTSIGIVQDGRIDESEIWFELAGIDQRFVLDVSAVPDPQAFFRALEDSANSGRSVNVAFDPKSGYFDSESAIPRYVVRRIDYDGESIAGMKKSRGTKRTVAASARALALGVAYYHGNFYDHAVRELDRALTDQGLEPALRALALKTRGHALTDTIWSTRQDPTEDDDRRFLRALEDFRAWAAIEPDNPEAQSAIAFTLRDLGAYEEALEIFREYQRRWPDDPINGATRIASTYRILGKYHESLAALDELVAREGPQQGMKFHYHRGSTLNFLGRYEEAVAEFTEGLETQPDYPGAFHRRACAYARLGKLEKALADRRRADAEWVIIWQDMPATPATRHDRQWAAGVAAALESAIAAGSKEPMAAPCEGDWHYGEKKRERSRLLPES